jgi:hypothetical protein
MRASAARWVVENARAEVARRVEARKLELNILYDLCKVAGYVTSCRAVRGAIVDADALFCVGRSFGVVRRDAHLGLPLIATVTWYMEHHLSSSTCLKLNTQSIYKTLNLLFLDDLSIVQGFKTGYICTFQGCHRQQCII